MPVGRAASRDPKTLLSAPLTPVRRGDAVISAANSIGKRIEATVGLPTAQA
jgi:hypothetical protein